MPVCVVRPDLEAKPSRLATGKLDCRTSSASHDFVVYSLGGMGFPESTFLRILLFDDSTVEKIPLGIFQAIWIHSMARGPGLDDHYAFFIASSLPGFEGDF